MHSIYNLSASAAAMAIMLAGCGGADSSAPDKPITVPPPAAAAPTPSPTTASTASAPCVSGTWEVAKPDPNDAVNSPLPVQYQTKHFAFRYKDGVADEAAVRTVGEHMEFAWSILIDKNGYPEPDCQNETKLKANMFIGQGYGLSGGVDGLGHMGMWVDAKALGDRFGLTHEFTHALQGSSGSLRDTPYGGWLWESHANWMTHQLPEFRSNTHCSVLSVNYPHLYYGSSRVRYCNWQFLEYLKNNYGYEAVNNIWRKAPKQGDAKQPTADPVEVLMTNQGWDITKMNDIFGDWAMHNANWDYTNPDGSDQGAVYRKSYGSYDPAGGDRFLRNTILDPIDLDKRRFAVPDAWAPQRWAYNMVKLYPDEGASTVTVQFRGITQASSATESLPGLENEPPTIASPNSGWRWGLVAVDSAGRSRYGALQRDANGSASLSIQPGDRGLFLVVVGAPTQFHHIQWDQPYYSIYRFPWMAQIDGAMPAGYQKGAPDPVPGGHRHPNGGGWVADDAIVDATAYVGPYARVLSGEVRGKARVEDHAVIAGGKLRDNARASALSVIRDGATISGQARAALTFLGLAEYEKGIVLSGTAQNIGDVEQRGASMSKGIYYGFVDQAAASDPRRGADLTAPVPEVTAKPSYVWKD